VATTTTGDVLAIQDVIAAYDHHVDFGEREELVALFAEDCELDLGPIRGSGHETVRRWGDIEARAASPRHYTTNVVVRVDGDRATASSYVQIFNTRPGEQSKQRVAGRYLDTLVRGGDGRWRFASRTFVEDPHSREVAR
jgi:ketosteroid isomerase-like protein